MPQLPPALRDLTPSTPDASRQWKVVGLERVHACTFCGAPSEATVGCPDENAPLVWQIGICNQCLVDCCMQRFREVKHQRMVLFADDMRSAANAVRKARDRAGQARYERGRFPKKPDPSSRPKRSASWPRRKRTSPASTTCAQAGPMMNSRRTWRGCGGSAVRDRFSRMLR